MHLVLLGDEGLLFDEPRQTVHALNTSASVIWCLMRDGLDEPELAAEVQATLGLEPSRAACFVREALTRWASDGWLAGTGPPPPPASVDVPRPVYAGPEPSFVAEHVYGLRGRRLALRFTTPAQVDVVHPVLAHLTAAHWAEAGTQGGTQGGPDGGPKGAGAEATRIDIIAGDEGIMLRRDGTLRATCETMEGLAPIAKSLVWQAGLEAGGFLLNIHAGVVAGPGGAVLLPAPPGGGKTTLTAALVRAGLTYYSDEVALLAPETLDVMPFPLALCVKDTGLATAASIFPTANALPIHVRADGRRVGYLPPPLDRMPAMDERCPVVAIVFPRYAPGVAGAMSRLSPPVTLARLFSQCTGAGSILTIDDVRRLVAWIDRVPGYELVFSNLAEAVSATAALTAPAAG